MPVPPFLGEFADEDAEWFASVGRHRQVRAGEVVIAEGVHPEHIHFILEGEFVVSSEALGDPEITRVGPGELLGEMSYINRVPPGGSVTATKDGLLLSVLRSDINARIEADPAFGSRFRKVISEFAVTRMYNYPRRSLGAADKPGRMRPAPPAPADPPVDPRVTEIIRKLLRDIDDLDTLED